MMVVAEGGFMGGLSDSSDSTTVELSFGMVT